MDDAFPTTPSRPTPQALRPFSRPAGSVGQPTPLSTRSILFVPGELRDRAALVASSTSPALEVVDPPASEQSAASSVELDVELVEEPPIEEPPIEEPPSVPTAREEVARLLEGLAARVRSAELSLPSGLPASGEAAVLAGLLAALLAHGGEGAASIPAGIPETAGEGRARA